MIHLYEKKKKNPKKYIFNMKLLKAKKKKKLLSCLFWIELSDLLFFKQTPKASLFMYNVLC